MVKFFDVLYSRNYTKSSPASTEIHEKPRANLKNILFSSKLTAYKINTRPFLFDPSAAESNFAIPKISISVTVKLSPRCSSQS